MIQINHLSFQYTTKRKILKDINLSVQKGDWVAILGHNGSGKSTLAKTIVGLLQPSEGEIFINGIRLQEDTLYEIRKQVGIVFQNPDNQFVGVTVRDDIAFGMENLNMPKAAMLDAIDFFAAKIGLSKLLDKEPSTLSGGQKQRVAIAGILAMKTQIMIFDEATSMLDPSARAEVMTYIKKLNAEGLTVIMITHDIEEALLANRMVILKQGEIIADGTKEELLHRPDLFVEARLELPASLQLYYRMKNEGLMTPELEATLWAFGLNA
jgi:energy-coupling factor transport system ATP-binding protein